MNGVIFSYAVRPAKLSKDGETPTCVEVHEVNSLGFGFLVVITGYHPERIVGFWSTREVAIANAVDWCRLPAASVEAIPGIERSVQRAI